MSKAKEHQLQQRNVWQVLFATLCFLCGHALLFLWLWADAKWGFVSSFTGNILRIPGGWELGALLTIVFLPVLAGSFFLVHFLMRSWRLDGTFYVVTAIVYSVVITVFAFREWLIMGFAYNFVF